MRTFALLSFIAADNKLSTFLAFYQRWELSLFLSHIHFPCMCFYFLLKKNRKKTIKKKISEYTIPDKYFKAHWVSLNQNIHRWNILYFWFTFLRVSFYGYFDFIWYGWYVYVCVHLMLAIVLCRCRAYANNLCNVIYEKVNQLLPNNDQATQRLWCNVHSVQWMKRKQENSIEVCKVIAHFTLCKNQPHEICDS